MGKSLGVDLRGSTTLKKGRQIGKGWVRGDFGLKLTLLWGREVDHAGGIVSTMVSN